MTLATWITRQVVFGGLVDGLTYGLLAMGVVLVFRSTRVINFAVGNMGLPATSLFALLVLNYHFPFWVALAVALAVGTLYGTLVELAVVRRLFTAPRVIVLIATVGVAQLSQALMLALPDIDTSGGARFPVAVGSTIDDLVGLRIRGPQLVVVVVVPLVAAALVWSLSRTTFGRAVLASADDPDLARLSGVSPKLVSTAVWTIAGFLSSLTMILIAGMSGSPAGLLSLGPTTMARALAAAVIAGMTSFPLALAAGVVLGIVQSLVRFNFFDQPGLIDFLLFIAVLVAVYLQSRAAADDEIIAFTPRVRPVPDELAHLWWLRNLGRLTLLGALAGAVVLPLLVDVPSRHFLYATVVGFAVCGLSVTVITGWAGQLSLSQMTFAGLGALFAATLVRGVELDVGYGSARLLDVSWGGLPFLAGVLLAPLFTAAVAVVIGLGALRVRGLMLAVSTFAFALAAEQYLYRRPFFTGGTTGGVPFARGTVLGIDLATQRRYYWFCLAGLVVAAAFVGHLRSSGVGRSIIAARDNAASASAYTIEPARTKLLAFALAGALAGFGGALLGGAFRSVRTSEPLFLVGDSLQLVAMVVIGGIGSVAGPVLGAIWVKGLPAFWPDNDLVPLLTSSIGLLILLLYFPGGLVQIGHRLRGGLITWALARHGGATSGARSGSATVHVRPAGREGREVPAVVLAARGVTVRFGGNLAVAGVDLTIARDEIVGLIGNNGAGKSTFMNAVGGYVPSTGDVELLGAHLDGESPARRAARGLGRTFQAATLFPELTLRETLMVALEARGRTPLLATALHLPSTRRLERRRRVEADEIIDYLGLGPYADAYVSDLSTGTRRIVEVAGLLAIGARVLCLDEPTAGLAQRETEAFAPLLKAVRAELGASMLVIEHDMPLIMSISDRVYCLEAGSVIAEGSPDEVRHDPAVIASYLGTDERTIARSDTVPGSRS